MCIVCQEAGVDWATLSSAEADSDNDDDDDDSSRGVGGNEEKGFQVEAMYRPDLEAGGVGGGGEVGSSRPGGGQAGGDGKPRHPDSMDGACCDHGSVATLTESVFGGPHAVLGVTDGDLMLRRHDTNVDAAVSDVSTSGRLSEQEDHYRGQGLPPLWQHAMEESDSPANQGEMLLLSPDDVSDEEYDMTELQLLESIYGAGAARTWLAPDRLVAVRGAVSEADMTVSSTAVPLERPTTDQPLQPPPPPHDDDDVIEDTEEETDEDIHSYNPELETGRKSQVRIIGACMGYMRGTYRGMWASSRPRELLLCAARVTLSLVVSAVSERLRDRPVGNPIVGRGPQAAARQVFVLFRRARDSGQRTTVNVTTYGEVLRHVCRSLCTHLPLGYAIPAIKPSRISGPAGA